MIKYFSIIPFMFLFFSGAIANVTNDSIYIYYDGANNKYILKGTTLIYQPVKPNESSSGTYSGGEEQTVTITVNESRTLTNLFAEALSNKKAQTNKNSKPNAAVEINFGTKKHTFLLKATAAINISLNKSLQQQIKKSSK